MCIFCLLPSWASEIQSLIKLKLQIPSLGVHMDKHSQEKISAEITAEYSIRPSILSPPPGGLSRDLWRSAITFSWLLVNPWGCVCAQILCAPSSSASASKLLTPSFCRHLAQPKQTIVCKGRLPGQQHKFCPHSWAWSKTYAGFCSNGDPFQDFEHCWTFLHSQKSNHSHLGPSVLSQNWWDFSMGTEQYSLGRKSKGGQSWVCLFVRSRINLFYNWQ